MTFLEKNGLRPMRPLSLGSSARLRRHQDADSRGSEAPLACGPINSQSAKLKGKNRSLWLANAANRPVANATRDLAVYARQY